VPAGFAAGTFSECVMATAPVTGARLEFRQAQIVMEEE
jgi:hypothetical protein